MCVKKEFFKVLEDKEEREELFSWFLEEGGV